MSTTRLYCTNAHHGLNPGDCLECDLLNAEADRDKIRIAVSWLLANRGHRGEEQAWKLLQDALGDSE